MKIYKSNISLKCINMLLVLLFFKIVEAQKVNLFYDVTKDRRWIAEQKQKITSFQDNRTANTHQKNLTQYFKICYKLGKYYEDLFDRKRVKNLARAIFYYELVADYGKFPDEKKYESNSAFKANLCRKLAQIYFSGRGVKKDKTLSIIYAKRGTTNTFFANYYSYKYFKSQNIVLGFYKQNDTIYTLKINPFTGILVYSKLKFIDNNLHELGKKFKNFIDTTLQIRIQTYSIASMASQATASHNLENIKTYLVEKVGINANKIYIENIIEGGPIEDYEIIFTRGY
jgi:hypothetical protein